MKICILNIFLAWLLSSFISQGAPGTCNIHYSRIDYTYSNISLKGGYEENVFFNGILKKNKKEILDISYTELEKIVSIEAGFAIENKWKDIKDFGTRSVIGGSFYSGVKSRTFVYDSQQNDTPISYKYTLKNQELMFLAFLPLNSYECVDTLSYSILIPEDLKLTYKISEDTTSLKSLTITNTKVKNGILWNFVSIVRNKCSFPDSDHPNIVSSKKLPGVRLSIVPAEGYEKEFSYMNDWYRNLIQTKSVLNNESKSIINKWVNSDDKVGIVKALFDSVKGKISYISFENGIGAVQPRDVNEVLNNKQGDCKDMANLLRQSIRMFGIEAWVALSSTIQHRFDLDFPSIASANHAICVVKIDDKLYFLDPTESFCPFGMPSRQIQGCHILIVDSLQGTLVEVPIVSADKNKVSAIFTLNKSGDNLAGSFIFVLKGLSKLDFETFKGSNSIQYFNSKLTQHLSSQFRNIKIDSIATTISDNEMTISGNIKASNTFISINEVSYLSQNMLMFPHSLPREISPEECLLMYETMDREFQFIIHMDQPVKLRKPNDESFKGAFISFDWKISNPDDKTVKFDYSIKCPEIKICDNSRKEYNEVNDFITKIFNKKLAYE